jgi:hypothetical protein
MRTFPLDSTVRAGLAQGLRDATGSPDTPEPVRLVAPALAADLDAGRLAHCGHPGLLAWHLWEWGTLMCESCVRSQLDIYQGIYRPGYCDRCHRTALNWQEFGLKISAGSVEVMLRIGLCSRCQGR